MRKSFYTDIAKLAIPTAIGNILSFSIGFVDHFMVSGLGRAAVSGIYLGNQVATLFYFLVVGLESGVAILGTQYSGRGDKKTLRKCGVVGAVLGIFLGLLLTFICIFAPKWVIGLFSSDAAVIEYGELFLSRLAWSFIPYAITRVLIAEARAGMRGAPSLFVPLISLIVNLSLNMLLIYGRWGIPALGVGGAAIATVAARVAELVIMLIYTLARARRGERTPIAQYSDIIKEYIRTTAPILLGQLVWAANTFFVTAIVAQANGGVAVAAQGVAGSLHNLLYTLMNAASSSVGVIIARTVGELSGGNDGHGCEKSTECAEGRLREYTLSSQRLFLAIGLLSCVVILLLMPCFIRLYRLTGEDAKIANQLIRVVALSFVGTCYSAASLFGIVKSGGDVGFVTKTDLYFLLFYTLPFGLIAYRLALPVWLLFLIIKGEHILKCIVAFLKVNSYTWVVRLTDRGERSAPLLDKKEQ